MPSRFSLSIFIHFITTVFFFCTKNRYAKKAEVDEWKKNCYQNQMKKFIHIWNKKKQKKDNKNRRKT